MRMVRRLEASRRTWGDMVPELNYRDVKGGGRREEGGAPPWHPGAHHPGHTRPRVETYPYLERGLGHVADLEHVHLLQDHQGHPRDLPRVDVPVLDGEAADHHVGVPDGLHLVHVEVLHDRVEQGVEVVEQVDDLHGRARRGYRGESHDVAGMNWLLAHRLKTIKNCL